MESGTGTGAGDRGTGVLTFAEVWGLPYPVSGKAAKCSVTFAYGRQLQERLHPVPGW